MNPASTLLTSYTGNPSSLYQYPYQYSYDPALLPLRQTLTGQAQQLATGQLPEDVQRQMVDQNAEWGVASGMPGSQFVQNRGLRDLGLNSLYGIQTATNMLGALKGNLLQGQIPQQQTLSSSSVNLPQNSGNGVNAATSQMIRQIMMKLQSYREPFNISVPRLGGGADAFYNPDAADYLMRNQGTFFDAPSGWSQQFSGYS